MGFEVEVLGGQGWKQGSAVACVLRRRALETLWGAAMDQVLQRKGQQHLAKTQRVPHPGSLIQQDWRGPENVHF